MKRIIIIFMSFVMSLVSYCPMTNAKEEQEKEIVIIERSTNFAWGAYDAGIFIDNEGNVYEFEFANGGDYSYINEIPNDEEMLELLYEIIEKEEPVKKVNRMFVLICDFISEDVDMDAQLIEKHYAFDAGQTTLYVVDNQKNIIEISSEGDYLVYRNDPAAIFIDSLYKHRIK